MLTIEDYYVDLFPVTVLSDMISIQKLQYLVSTLYLSLRFSLSYVQVDNMF